MSARKGGEKKGLIIFRQVRTWACTKKLRYDFKREDNISWVLGMCRKLTMCQKHAPSLSEAEPRIEPRSFHL